MITWIKIEDKLPDIDDKILVTDGKVIFTSVYWGKKIGFYILDTGGYDFETKYWIPLPKLPK